MSPKLCTRGLLLAGAFSGAMALAACNRDVPPESVTPPAPAPAPAAATEPAAARPSRPVVAKTAVMSSATPDLADKAKVVLNKGADIDLAVQGFQSPQQFMATAYAARNNDIPFVLLKEKVVTQKVSLANAIKALSKNSVNASAEAARAESEARADLAKRSGPQ
jgi:hypothetical protein